MVHYENHQGKKLSSNYCDLCVTEKFYILENIENKSLLNTRNEFISKCRHQNITLLANVKYDTKDSLIVV